MRPNGSVERSRRQPEGRADIESESERSHTTYMKRASSAMNLGAPSLASTTTGEHRFLFLLSRL